MKIVATIHNHINAALYDSWKIGVQSIDPFNGDATHSSCNTSHPSCNGDFSIAPPYLHMWTSYEQHSFNVVEGRGIRCPVHFLDSYLLSLGFSIPAVMTGRIILRLDEIRYFLPS